ncbi:MAG TPA: T9SS type A sorting domain-containing protein [Flavobacteriales bacterium]|nr:T9SS type A sorting domain-containing protein [Flavobacteriales bacterium]
MKYTAAIFFSLLILQLKAQQLLVNPYLQDASPTSITVMWEADGQYTSLLKWGTSPALGDTVIATGEVSFLTSYIYTANLTGLLGNTKYYYRVNSGGVSSITYDFITPAEQSEEASFNLAAVSDMQQDGGNPNKFYEVVHSGIIDYIQDTYGSAVNENLGMVLIPGDLVDNGLFYNEWKDQFFDPADPLFGYVPVYPVPGNHEYNSDYFFKYFHLPENGTGGYEEHWWYKDRSNVRIVGMDSNTGYQIQAQLDWLDSLLAATASDPQIEFVFAQLHHPHKSELWIAGETPYTGQVVERLENFTTSTGKPSIHFFGHTHGYSRGQSKDHTHLWVNVATAGGNIDYWGEFAQADYDEFTISQDEYGYVIVEVDAGTDPRFTLKRFSIGDEFVTKDNSLEDSITIRLNNNSPGQPTGIFPANGDTVNPDCFILLGDDFSDQDGDEHGASQWQVSNGCSDFTSPVIDRWRQFENWYFEINTQLGDDLVDEEASAAANTAYCWRVRYRDKGLAWSAWSDPIPFYTSSTQLTANFLANPGAEAGIGSWTVEAGVLESLESGECSGTSPFAGQYYFAVGAICTENQFGAAYQQVDISSYSAYVDDGVCTAVYGGYLSDWGGQDIPSVALEFLDSGNNVLSGTDTSLAPQTSWTLVDEQWAVPVGTRFIRYIIMGERLSGTDNDSYFDELFLQLNLVADSCSQYTPPVTSSGSPLKRRKVRLFPNPVSNGAVVNIPISSSDHLIIRIYNSSGKLARLYDHVHPPTFYFNKTDLPNGLYLMQILDGKRVLDNIKFGVVD